MRLEEAYIMRKQECKALQHENSKLLETIEQLRKGAYSDPDKIDHIKQIAALTREIQKKDKIIERYKKLYEEKLMSEEGLKKTDNDRIHIGSPIPFDEDAFIQQLDKLMQYAYANRSDIRQYVEEMVSTYHPA